MTHQTPSSLPAHSLSPLIGAVPTTQLTLDHLRTLCRPVFEEGQLSYPKLAWVGIFGYEQTDRDNDINFLVGFAAGANYFRDVCGSCEKLQKKLSKILDMEVDVMEFLQDGHHYGVVQMEGLLTAKTIWGDPSWVHSSRETAERLLREGYEITKKALQVASRLEKRLPLSQAQFESPENKSLRLSILEDALLVITTVKVPKHPFYIELRCMMPLLTSNEGLFRAALEGEVQSSKDLEDIWKAVSDGINVIAPRWMMWTAERMFNLAGLVP